MESRVPETMRCALRAEATSARHLLSSHPSCCRDASQSSTRLMSSGPMTMRLGSLAYTARMTSESRRPNSLSLTPRRGATPMITVRIRVSVGAAAAAAATSAPPPVVEPIRNSAAGIKKNGMREGTPKRTQSRQSGACDSPLRGKCGCSSFAAPSAGARAREGS